jgi:gas vesicle protein
MSHKNNSNNLLMGAAIAAGIAGTLATLLWPEKQPGWTQAKKVAGDKWETWTHPRPDHFSRNFLIGSLAGSVIAAATALLVAPMPGKELIREIGESLPGLDGHAPVKKARSRPSRAKQATAGSSAKRVERKGGSSSSSRKKTAHKKAATPSETQQSKEQSAS